MWSKILIYIWMGLTAALIVVPTGVLLYRIGKKLFWFLNKKADLIKENVELKHIKSELKQQKDELIASNEYGPFHAQEQEIEDKKLDNENLVAPSEWEENHSSLAGNQEGELKGQTSEKEKKRLDTLLLEAELLKNEWKVEQYEKKLIEATAIDDSTLKVLKPLADLYFTLGNYKKALPLLKKISEQDPTDHKVIWQIAEIYFVTGDIQTSELLVEKAINLKNDNPKYYLTMVEIYYNTDRNAEALAYMEKVIKLRPTNPKYLLTIAELYEQVGDLDNAKKYYFNVLEYEQNNEKAKAKIREFTREI